MRTLNDMKITIDKKHLLKILRDNQERHQMAYEEARSRFRQKVVEKMEERLIELKEPSWTDMKLSKVQRFDLPVPEDYTHDYQEVIDMLEMAEEKKIVITSHQFHCWCKDKWDWTPSFRMSSGAYL